MIVGIVENEIKVKEYICDKLMEDKNVSDVISWVSAEEALDDPNLSNLDLIFLDIGLDGMDGITLTGILSSKFPTLKKIILTNMNSEETVFNALKKGAIGYISKSEMNDLHDTINAVIEGGAIISPTIALRVLDFFKKEEKSLEADKVKLTPKEQQILEQLVQGYSPSQLADLLKVKISTIRFHIRGIYEKLEVRNRTEMMLKLKELGML
ncbi:MAG: response regulator transcription factor [Spirochaetia bacterium]|nr:response regulator transcription factor [Spirochaetia bacterium]